MDGFDILECFSTLWAGVNETLNLSLGCSLAWRDVTRGSETCNDAPAASTDSIEKALVLEFRAFLLIVCKGIGLKLVVWDTLKGLSSGLGMRFLGESSKLFDKFGSINVSWNSSSSFESRNKDNSWDFPVILCYWNTNCQCLQMKENRSATGLKNLLTTYIGMRVKWYNRPKH